MLNPYEVLYDSEMNIYRYQNAKDDAGFDTSGDVCVASRVKCRYSLSGQNTAGLPVPSVSANNQLFCGLEADIQEGDKVVVTLRSGKEFRLRVGEVHPYTFQYQCRVERDEKA